jgi:uncharacterized repeat protein (TIGR03943 family)
LSLGRRHAYSAVLATWAIFFAAIWLTDETGRYLGGQTAWVVPFGAVVTGCAALLLMARGRLANDRRLRPSEAAGILALLSPIVAVLAVPQAELGAAAAERRSSGDLATSLAAAPSGQGREFSLAHIMVAGTHPQPDVKEGIHVRLLGFVMTREGTPPGEFQVTRFMITCCVADATPLFVTVDPRGAVPARDSWVVVTGALAYREGIEESAGWEGRPPEFVVANAEVEEIPPPAKPYIWGGRGDAPPPVRHGTRPPDPTKS